MGEGARLWAGLEGSDLLRLGDTIQALAVPGCAGYVATLSDGRMSPKLGVPLELVRALKGVAGERPVQAAVLVESPERWLKALAESGAARVSIPVEAGGHLHRTIAQARELGLRPGASLFPGTTLAKLDYLLRDLDFIVLHSSEPDAALPRFRTPIFDRVRILRENLRYHKLRARIQAAGPFSTADAARLLRLGADELVLDGANLYGEPGINPGESLERFERRLAVGVDLV